MEASEQRIRRGKHTKNYVVVGNALAQNRNLSYEARGLLIDLLSRPENWEVSVAALMIPGKAGRDKVKGILNELIKAGYITDRKRKRGEDGKFYYTPYQVDEVPLTGNPSTVEPSADEPSTENPHLQSTEEQSIETQQKTDEKSSDITPSPHTVPVPTRTPAREGEGSDTTMQKMHNANDLEGIRAQLLASFGHNAKDLSRKQQAELNDTAARLHARGITPAQVMDLYDYVYRGEVRPPDKKGWDKPHLFSYRHLIERYASWRRDHSYLWPSETTAEPAGQTAADFAAPKGDQTPAAEPTVPEEPRQPAIPTPAPRPVLIPKPDPVIPEPRTPAVEPERWALVMQALKRDIGDCTYTNGLRLVGLTGNTFTVECLSSKDAGVCRDRLGDTIKAAVGQVFDVTDPTVTYVVEDELPAATAKEVAA